MRKIILTVAITLAIVTTAGWIYYLMQHQAPDTRWEDVRTDGATPGPETNTTPPPSSDDPPAPKRHKVVHDNAWYSRHATDYIKCWFAFDKIGVWKITIYAENKTDYLSFYRITYQVDFRDENDNSISTENVTPPDNLGPSALITPVMTRIPPRGARRLNVTVVSAIAVKS